jgi:hypothetical protein
MFEYRAIWNVQGGGTGYSVFHVRESPVTTIGAAAQQFATDLRAGFSSLASSLLPDDVSINFDSEARELNVVGGTLISVIPVNAPATVTGTSSSTYSAPTGARVDLITGGIVAGRRLRGRTYIVPVIGTAYTTNGVLSTTAQSTLETAFGMFDGVPNVYSLAVWSRTHDFLADVQSINVPPEAAILRSRRE